MARKSDEMEFACPFIDEQDSRCAGHFSLCHLDEAFNHCFGNFRQCPSYYQIKWTQARDRIAITIAGQPAKPVHAAAS